MAFFGSRSLGLLTDARPDELFAGWIYSFQTSGALETSWPEVHAVAVSGSAARDEEIWEGDHLVSDIDMMVFTERRSLRLSRGIGAVIERHRTSGIDGGRIPLYSLARYGLISFYEARHNGIVVAGERTVLDLIPMESPRTIPKWEAVRTIWKPDP